MKVKSKEQLDRIIITMVKLYPTNLTYSFKRVSEITGFSTRVISGRWYSNIRHRSEVVYKVVSDEVEIRNTKTTRSDLIEKLMKTFRL
jgi:hypothetical protein